MTLVRFQCVKCDQEYEIPFEHDPVDISFICRCGTPLHIHLTHEEPDDQPPVLQ